MKLKTYYQIGYSWNIIQGEMFKRYFKKYYKIRIWTSS